jgi:hypothetical protein
MGQRSRGTKCAQPSAMFGFVCSRWVQEGVASSHHGGRGIGLTATNLLKFASKILNSDALWSEKINIQG